jgi:hypothetical protein
MWTWLSLAAFVYCLFRWYCELIRGEMRRAEQAVQQNTDVHRIPPDRAHLLINDPYDDVSPVATTPARKFTHHLSPDEELVLESIVGAASLSLDVNGVPLKPEDEFRIAGTAHALPSLALDSAERPPKPCGFFAPAAAMRQTLFGDALHAELSADLAETLAEREGLLRLDHLTSLTPETARALAKHRGELTLNGLTELLPEVAQALARHKGFLQLNGLTTLTQEAAEALAHSKGLLRLNGLTTLSPEAAEALAKYDGLLVLSGLTTLTPEAVAALRTNPAMKLPEQFKQQKAGTAFGIAVGQM